MTQLSCYNRFKNYCWFCSKTLLKKENHCNSRIRAQYQGQWHNLLARCCSICAVSRCIVPYVYLESMLMALLQLWRSVCCLTGIRSACQLRWCCSSWERHVEKVIEELHISSPSLSCKDKLLILSSCRVYITCLSLLTTVEPFTDFQVTWYSHNACKGHLPLCLIIWYHQ
jgi:hypothetical protein